MVDNFNVYPNGSIYESIASIHELELLWKHLGTT